VRQRLQNPAPRSSDFDLALANLTALPREEALQAVSAYSELLKATLAKVSGKQQTDENGTELPFHVAALFEHSLVHLRCELDWLEHFARRLAREEGE